MTREELENIYDINKEIKMWERELKNRRSKSLTPSTAPHIGGGITVNDKIGENAKRNIELENKISELRERLHQERDRATEYILTISDSFYRRIVFYRCVSFMSWRRIAYEMGGGNTEESVRQAYSRFMRNL